VIKYSVGHNEGGIVSVDTTVELTYTSQNCNTDKSIMVVNFDSTDKLCAEA